MVAEKNNINIKDIARLAGVSVTTVSHTLSGNRYVKEETKNKILKIIKQHSYEPNIIARSLIKKRSGLVGIITTALNNEFYSEIIASIEESLNPQDYIIIVNSSNHDPVKELNVFRKSNSLFIDGIFLVGSSIKYDYVEKYNYRNIPVVLVNRGCQGKSYPTVTVNYLKAMKEIVSYLAETGHENIGYLGWAKDTESVSVEKFNGYIKGLKINGLKKDDNIVFLKDDIMRNSFEEAYIFLRQSLSGKPAEKLKMSALVCQTDHIAVGAIKALNELNLGVPEDISVTGFGNTSVGRFSVPALTTVSVPKKEIGKLAAQTFLKLCGGKQGMHEFVLLDCPVIVRKSTRIN
ncbi:MAG: LacI family DNA-binding transcriptional regulator [Actinobacteria bacterium]|nr:LacI family DNA-binding transcriptional regulator [Actinomycetota bacterium]